MLVTKHVQLMYTRTGLHFVIQLKGSYVGIFLLFPAYLSNHRHIQFSKFNFYYIFFLSYSIYVKKIDINIKTNKVP